MTRKLLLVLLSGTLLPLSLTSCATSRDSMADAPTRDDSRSSIPWNRPMGWEGTAGLPGMPGGAFRGGR